MSDLSFERRAHSWLELGPTEAPAVAVQAVLAGIETVAQERRPLRLAGRRVPASRPQLLAAAAAVVLAVVAGGALLLRAPGPNVATPRASGHLLFDYPETRTILERSGGPTTAAEDVSLGRLTGSPAFVLAAVCDGGGSMTLRTYDANEEVGIPEGAATAPPKQPTSTADVPCNGRPVHDNIAGSGYPVEYDVVLAVPSGVTWSVAVGGYADLAAPQFPPYEPTDGWYLVIDGGAMLTTSDPGPGIGIQVPPNATSVAVIVQCSGSPITIAVEGQEPTDVACDDPSTTTRIAYPAEGLLGFDVRAGTDRISWVRMAAEANGEIGTQEPPAPSLPDGLADVRYVDGDGQFVAIGTLGSNEQTLIQLPGSRVGLPGGDHVGVVSTVDGKGRLELWSLSEARPVGALADVPVDRVFRSWVDETHEVVIYGLIAADFSAEWHRVAFDGSDDEIIATSPGTVVMAQSDIAIDDSAFVVETCTPLACTRTVHDLASGESTEIVIEGERTCNFLGIAAGQLIATSSPDCETWDAGRVTATPLDGGARRVLFERPASGQVVETASGPQVVLQEGGDGGTVISVVPLDGGEPRELARFGVESTRALSQVRLPAGDWVLIAGPLADTPTNQSIGREVPLLLNLQTGEQIELVNLPSSG